MTAAAVSAPPEPPGRSAKKNNESRKQEYPSPGTSRSPGRQEGPGKARSDLGVPRLPGTRSNGSKGDFRALDALCGRLAYFPATEHFSSSLPRRAWLVVRARYVNTREETSYPQVWMYLWITIVTSRLTSRKEVSWSK